jgi:hypothetical protein
VITKNHGTFTRDLGVSESDFQKEFPASARISFSTFPATLLPSFIPLAYTTTTNEMEPLDLPDASPNMKAHEVRDALAKLKIAFKEIDKITAEKIQRVRDNHAEQKRRSAALAGWNSLAEADHEQVAHIVVSTRPT